MRPLRTSFRAYLLSGLTLAGLTYSAACGEDNSPSQRPGRNATAAGTAAPGNGSNGITAVPGQTGNATPAGLLITPTAAGAGAGGDGCHNATIAFVIDGSGSMCEPFGNSTRWTELRTALLAKDVGLMYRLNALASQGLYIYDGGIDFQLALQQMSTGPMATCMGGGGMRRGASGCPQIVEVKPAAGNAAAMDAKYPNVELGGSTPTDKAMNYVVDELGKVKGRSPNDPQFILLATDGQPNDICMGGMGGDGTMQQRNVIAAADRATAMGITTFVVSLATDPALQMHLDEVARHGDPKDPAAHAYTPTNTADLVNTLTKLLGTAVGCLF
jgi:hypothetical protein